MTTHSSTTNIPDTDVVTVTHPHAALLEDVARTWNDVHAGRWGIAAELCASRLRDPAATAHELNLCGETAAVPDFDQLLVSVGDGQVTFHARPQVVTAALDLFMRILCGQWDEMSWHVGMFNNGLRMVGLTQLRAVHSREYDNTVPWDERAFPPYANASISIAQATLPARLAYHSYKELGGGTPGSPTFGLPDGPVTVEVTKSAPRTAGPRKTEATR